MKYIVQDSEGKKMIMTVVSSMPQLPEGFEVLGKAEELPEAIAEIEAQSVSEKEKAEARQFLNNTDWYVVRMQETGKPIPQDITDARESARILLSK